jgi:hypothetical protein
MQIATLSNHHINPYKLNQRTSFTATDKNCGNVVYIEHSHEMWRGPEIPGKVDLERYLWLGWRGRVHSARYVFMLQAEFRDIAVNGMRNI